MQPTRRFWGTAGVGVVLTAAAVLFARPLLFVPAAAVFAWLLASQVAFVHALSRFDDSLAVTQSFDREATVVDDPAVLSITVDGTPASLSVTVRPQMSAGLISESEVDHEFGDLIQVSLRSPVAGTHRVSSPEFEIRDPIGLFSERLARGPPKQLRVEPRRPRRVHVGEGGDTIAASFGEHTGSRGEGGLVPAELREYTTAESANRIDWKATARLPTTHVREFEAETDLATILIIDARSGLDIGTDGETAMDYLRAAALNYLAAAKSLGDPVGCFGIDDDGVRRLVAPTSSTRGLERVREAISDLTSESDSGRRRRTPPLAVRSRQLDRETTFGRTLATYTGARPPAASSADPVTAAVRSARQHHSGTVQFAVFTDDADRADVRNAVGAAKPADNPISVFLAPRVLYEPGSLAELPRAAERYGGFERFRRTLANLEGVRAMEVAPGDRLDTVLEATAIEGASTA
ncbi:DUF58 domain-containing protein [Natronomonas halophila]|uniref:DUF58 domain-containing protein n=1 Tax=Natronomonas halophila TaxID=2747817 RepID=UPI0015B4E807|nr:DUF58 domain-containing protein [Natronomonas halophila]QLD87049.1 DUF58 domain-containing protein [Natronomonas halophila]